MSSRMVFHSADYGYMAHQIAAALAAKSGQIETRSFPDGERYLRLVPLVRGCDAILVGGTINDHATLDIFDLGCALVGNGCRSLTLIVPFYGYSTMERAVKAGEVIKAKTRARLLSAIPIAPFGNLVTMLDLHAEGIPFYFEGGVKTLHLYARAQIIDAAKRLGGHAFVFGCVDAGRAKWVESLAEEMNVTAGFVYKRRGPDGQTIVSGVNVSVEGRSVVIYDDMIRSGGSVIGAAKAYKEAGAGRIFVITTHGLFTQGAVQSLKDSGLIERVVCTDSHPNSLRFVGDPFVEVIPTAPIFSAALR